MCDPCTWRVPDAESRTVADRRQARAEASTLLARMDALADLYGANSIEAADTDRSLEQFSDLFPASRNEKMPRR